MTTLMERSYRSAPGAVEASGAGSGVPRAEPAMLGVDSLPPSPWVVVLAGGEGRRLQRFVRQFLQTDRPKQFCRIVGTRSMLRHTWDRAAQVTDPSRILTVITAGQERYLDEEARAGVPGPVLVQPENKDTAAGLLLPLVRISDRAPTAPVVVFPADHFVWEETRFAAYVRAAVAAADAWPDRLILLGVEAAGPDSSYGWIAPGAPVAASPDAELYTVRRFWEKPDPGTASRLFACGYFWNTLVLVGRVGAYLRLADECLPDVVRPLREAGAHVGERKEAWAVREAYGRIPPANFSHALLARRPEALMVLVARGIHWSDWGDPDRIVQTVRRFDRRPTWLSGYMHAPRGPALHPAPVV